MPIVAVTASTFEEDRRRVEEAGGNAFIAKPLRETDLLRTVGRLLGVEYLGDEEIPVPAPDVPGPAAFSAIPEPVRLTLLDATARGDYDRILALTLEMEATAPAVARALRMLAEHFEYDKIHSLLETAAPGREERPA